MKSCYSVVFLSPILLVTLVLTATLPINARTIRESTLVESDSNQNSASPNVDVLDTSSLGQPQSGSLIAGEEQTQSIADLAPSSQDQNEDSIRTSTLLEATQNADTSQDPEQDSDPGPSSDQDQGFNHPGQDSNPGPSSHQSQGSNHPAGEGGDLPVADDRVVGRRSEPNTYESVPRNGRCLDNQVFEDCFLCGKVVDDPRVYHGCCGDDQAAVKFCDDMMT